jgi:metallo-beta-lactamase family protein
LLYLLAEHYVDFLDSPMAIAASRVYWRNPGRFDEEAARLRESFHGLPPLPNLVLCETGDD